MKERIEDAVSDAARRIPSCVHVVMDLMTLTPEINNRATTKQRIVIEVTIEHSLAMNSNCMIGKAE
jgi:hypothetical protein